MFILPGHLTFTDTFHLECLSYSAVNTLCLIAPQRLSRVRSGWENNQTLKQNTFQPTTYVVRIYALVLGKECFS